MDPFSEAVSNAELLSRITNRPAAQRLMERFGSLTALSKASFGDLCRVEGVGRARAAAVKSAFHLSSRLAQERWSESPLVDAPEKVADLLREPTRGVPVETFHVLLLNSRRRLIEMVKTSQGTLDTILIDSRIVFSRAIARNASTVVLAHTHPSGDPTPSEADIRVTRDLIRAGKLLRIEVLDHVILGEATIQRPCDYLSLRELGYFADV